MVHNIPFWGFVFYEDFKKISHCAIFLYTVYICLFIIIELTNYVYRKLGKRDNCYDNLTPRSQANRLLPVTLQHFDFEE